MTLPSQFSLEEENFYKDIQDLVKKGSQNEKELSLFLERYMDLLARADLDDETFIINFTKAGLIIEASAKVYGTKVDRLWINLEHVLGSLKNKNQGCKKKTDGEEEAGDDVFADVSCDELQEEGKRKLPNSGRRKKKVGDALYSADDFAEIDNITGLLGRNMNETKVKHECKIKLCEKVPNMFIKNKTKKKKMDVCLNKNLEDKDVIRLRDWVISADGLLVKEIYTPLPDNTISVANILDQEEIKDALYDSERFSDHGFPDVEDNLNRESLSENLKNEKNNNTEVGADREQNLKEPAAGDKYLPSEEEDCLANALNVSKESDMDKFPNILNRLSGDCLVDVDEVFWNSSKFQDVIPSKKMRAGKTNKPPCQLCADKKDHKRKSKRCTEDKKFDCLDSYFLPHVQPTPSEPHLCLLPDEELYNAFRIEMKVIEHLGKANIFKNIYEAYHPDEKPEELKNFLGFDSFENYLMKRVPALLTEDDACEDDVVMDALEDECENRADDCLPEKEFELPLPVVEASVRPDLLPDDPGAKSDDFLANSESEYQKLVSEELKDHYAAKTSFARNKELGMKISKWHEMIADKVKLSQKRGALNMNVLAEIIMQSFPSTDDVPVMPFRDLVLNKNRRDVPRYFFACLQLTNEGNLDIFKSNHESLATDCMVIKRLRTTRTNCELDECANSPSARLNSSKAMPAPTKRKRNSLSKSPSILESEDFSRNKKLKPKVVKCYKRSKNFNAKHNSKKRRCSVSSADSMVSE